MRKTFKLFCAAALAALAVSSCGKIWDELDDVQGQLNSIEARLDSLETSLNGQVATINTTLGTLAKADEKLAADIAALVKDAEATKALLEKLDAADGTINGKIDDLAAALAKFEDANEKALAEIVAKIAVVNVEKNKTGNYVLTFADGSTLEVAAADANANNTGLVTVVDGKWAVVGADGKTTVLDAEVHPDTKIDFKVEENTLFVSYDGGKTWEKTDVVVNDKTTINVVEDFKYTEGDAFVTITVGGKEYQLPLYEAGASLVLGRTDFFLMYGATKDVELTAEEISEYYVMSKPDGWKATIDGTTLKVVAPEKKTYEVGAAETEGEILIHATTSSGLCKVAKLEVKTGDGLTMKINSEGNVVITNAYTTMSVGEMDEPTMTFANFYVGWASSELTEDPKAYFELFNKYGGETPDWTPCVMLYNLSSYAEHQFSFVEVENEIDVIETTMNDIYYDFNYEDLPYGTNCVFWAAPVDEKGQVIIDAAVYYPYTHLLHEVELTEVTHNDATLNLNLEGATAYLVTIIEPWFEENGNTLEEYMEQMGEWSYVKEGFADYLPLIPAGDYTGENAIKISDVFGELNFDSKYYYVVFPYMEDMTYTEYKTQFAPYVYEFKTNALEAGADYKATLGEVTADYTSVSVAVTPAENTTVYYMWFPTDEFAEFENDDAVISAIFAEDYPNTLSYEEVVSATRLDAGETVILATVSVGNDGKYGALVTKSCTTKALPSVVDADLTVAVGVETTTYNTISVNVTPETNTVVYYYFCSETMANSWETDAEVAAYVMAKPKGVLTEATDVTASNLAQGSTNVLVMVVVDAETETSYNVVKKTYKTKAYPYSKDITVALNTISYDSKTKVGTVVFDVSGATDLIFGVGYFGQESTFEYAIIQSKTSLDSYDAQTIPVVDGKAIVEISGYDDYMTLYASGVVMTDDVVTALSEEIYSSTIKAALGGEAE